MMLQLLCVFLEVSPNKNYSQESTLNAPFQDVGAKCQIPRWQCPAFMNPLKWSRPTQGGPNPHFKNHGHKQCCNCSEADPLVSEQHLPIWGRPALGGNGTAEQRHRGVFRGGVRMERRDILAWERVRIVEEICTSF